MSDQRITRPPFCITRKAPSREPLNGQNSLRVYNYAPGLIALQVRGTNSYHAITLTPSHVAELRDMLEAALADMTSELVEN